MNILLTTDKIRCSYCQKQAIYELPLLYSSEKKDYYCNEHKNYYKYELQRETERKKVKEMFDREIKFHIRPDGTMKTPEEECPEYSEDSMGWRMGYGEGYRMIYDEWKRRRSLKK